MTSQHKGKMTDGFSGFRIDSPVNGSRREPPAAGRDSPSSPQAGSSGSMGAYPGQARTGSDGYLENLGSVAESEQRMNVDPLPETIRRACRHVRHSPASGSRDGGAARGVMPQA